MTIYLKQLAKRYGDIWIFKNFSYDFIAGNKYAVLGANGSGKSTLLRIIANMQNANKGTIEYQTGNNTINPEKIFKQVSFCAPGMDIIEEMTLREFLTFHFSFKKLAPAVTIDHIIREMKMEGVQHKFIYEFSSGMKQRVKLAQAFFADTTLLLLDEPCSNLDAQGVELYQDWLSNYTLNRIVIVASNDEREYHGVDALIPIEDFK